ncbi:putative outer membrane or exported [Escherichia fergusonii ATCC 35469]|uniref:Multidrug efflux pump accessory protein AcrZ n=2 Tax=Escherichia fergusonii TaxID=564 RepID=B7LJZ7_ESCF3|nr:putative outer membrane or exported [Escherichia fergusonii ATCC 35469]
MTENHCRAKTTAQKGSAFLRYTVRINKGLHLELTMLELLKSLVFAVIMVPIVMAIILGLIYGLGEVFNIFSGIGQKDQSRQNH